jgi:hypothetical protein
MNALFTADTVSGQNGRIRYGLPVDAVLGFDEGDAARRVADALAAATSHGEQSAVATPRLSRLRG